MYLYIYMYIFAAIIIKPLNGHWVAHDCNNLSDANNLMFKCVQCDLNWVSVHISVVLGELESTLKPLRMENSFLVQILSQQVI